LLVPLDVVPFLFFFLLEVDGVLLDCFVLDPASDEVLLPGEVFLLCEVDALDVLLNCVVLLPASDEVLLLGEVVLLCEADAPDILLVCVVLSPASDKVLLLGEVVLLCEDNAPEAVLLLGEVEFLFDEEVDVRFLVTALEALNAVLLPSGSVLESCTSATSGSVNIAAFLPAAAIRLSLFSALVNVFLDLFAIFGVLSSIVSQKCHTNLCHYSFSSTTFFCSTTLVYSFTYCSTT
jgi:hypothetical protein